MISFNDTDITSPPDGDASLKAAPTYDVPGSNPKVAIVDEISRRAKEARNRDWLYDALDKAKDNVCASAHDPDEDVLESFNLRATWMEVYFQRVYPSPRWSTYTPVKYGELCSAVRGIREYIDLHQLYQTIHVRVFLYRVKAVRCDITINSPNPGPTSAAAEPGATIGTIQEF